MDPLIAPHACQTTNLSMLYPTIEEKKTLLEQDKRYNEHEDLLKKAEESDTTLNIKNEAKKAFREWSPIIEKSDRNFSDLQKRFHPAIVKDGKLFRINDIGIDVINDSFIMGAKLEEELINVAIVKHTITYHSNSYYGVFIPSIGEVLNELPQEIIDAKDDFYFTAVLIDEHYMKCSVGYFRAYHIAITSVFTADKKE